MKQKTTVEQTNPDPRQQAVEDIAENILALSASVQPLLGGKLKRKAIVLLLAHSSSLPQYQVNQVLAALENMGKDWLEKGRV